MSGGRGDSLGGAGGGEVYLHEAGAGVDEKCLRERLNGRRGFNIVWGGEPGGGGGQREAVSNTTK